MNESKQARSADDFREQLLAAMLQGLTGIEGLAKVLRSSMAVVRDALELYIEKSKEE